MAWADLAPLANHLWQSTVFAAIATMLAVTLRRNRAEIRYGLWFAASCKFLVPISLLMSLGGYFRAAPAARQIVAAAVSSRMGRMTEPFWDSAPVVRAVPGVDWVAIGLVGIWACGFAAIAFMRFRGWLRVRAAVRSSVAAELPDTSFSIRMSPGLIEPGVVGFFRPVLILPEGIVDRLTPAQFETVLAHELCHVRRRDNLTSAVHMIVESVFWFHPLVWWIGARLVEERERACDEEVLRLGSPPLVYAEAILNVCLSYLSAPIACMPGISSSGLRKRIETIMALRVGQDLSLGRKALLAAAGAAAVILPVALGVLTNARTSDAQPPSESASAFSYVASVKENVDASPRSLSEYYPGGWLSATATTVRYLLGIAYGNQDNQLVGAPAWFSTKRYDIAAKVEGVPAPSQPVFLRTLLKDRFGLAAHYETRQLPRFALTMARSGGRPGLQLIRSDFDCAAYRASAHAPPEPGKPPTCGMRVNAGEISGRAIPLTQLATSLAYFVKRFTVDETGLSGAFDVELTWAPEAVSSNAPPESAPDVVGPSIFTALQEQLGLKLVSEKGPVRVLVVDHAQEPSGN